MGILDLAKKKAEEVYITAVEKSSELAEKAKVQTDILKKKQDLEALYLNLGEKTYLERTGIKQDEHEIEAMISGIRDLRDALDALQNKQTVEETGLAKEDVVDFDNAPDAESKTE